MKIKRILSVIIAVCMMLSLVPAPLAAANNAATSYEYVTSFKSFNALEKMYSLARGATFNNPLTGTSAAVNFNTDPVLRNLGGTKRLLGNIGLMNRNATCAVGADGKECTPFSVMNLDKTVPWDVVVNAGNAVEITSNNIPEGFMQKLFEVARYGNKNSGWFLALRLNVPTSGRFSLEMDAYADVAGVVPAIYFFEDDGSVVDDATARTALRNNTPVGYHDFSGEEDSGYMPVADVNIAEPGEYILIIFPDDSSAAKNANTISNKYQYMNLEGIRLTPLAGEYEYLTSFEGVDVLGKMYALSRGATFNNPITGTSATVNFNTDPVLRNLGGSNRLLANTKFMNRNATCEVDANGNKCEPFVTMNLKKTTAWDVVSNVGNAVEITNQKTAKGLLSKVFRVSDYGSKNSGWLLALRLNVPSAGKYNLQMDSYGDAVGVVPAIYFFADDGTVVDDASVRTALRSYEPVGYHDFSDIQTDGYKSVAKVDVKKPGDYILIIFPDDTSLSKNENVASGYQYMYLESIKLSPVAGEFDKINLSLDGIEEGVDPIPLNTTSKLNITLVDSRDMIIDDAAPEDISASYSSSDDTVAVVDNDGNIEATGAGETTITAEVTYDGITRTAEYKLLVAPAGKNLMSHLNPTLEEDKWVWLSERDDTAPSTPKFMRTGIGVAPKESDENNRAFGITFDPDVELKADPASIYLALDGSRVEVKPGRFYQLSFKMKADYAVPQNAADIGLLLDMFAYNNISGTSSSNIPINIGRSMFITKTPLWQEIRNGWTEVTVPVAAPTEAAVGKLYLTPRIMLDFNNADFGKAGYEGTIWFDDFELHEVGYAGVELEVQGDATASNPSGLTVVAKPYTTTGQYISISSDCLPGAVKFDTSDKYVVGDFKNIQRIEKASGHGMYWTGATANMGGKNGTADIFAEITLNGVMRKGTATVTTSGFGIKLLYAEAKTEDESVKAGATTKIFTTGYLSDGSEADLSGAVITYKSLTPDIVKVDNEGNATALRAGKGQVRVNIILEKSSVLAVADVTCTDSSPIKEATLAGPASVGYLRDEQLVLEGVTENNFAADISAAKVTWFVESDPQNGVTVSDGGKVFGKIKGATAAIYAEVELNGNKVTTNSITVTVGESDLRDFVIDFVATSKEKPIDVKISEDGWEINLEKSHSSVTSSVFRSYGLYATTNSVGRDLVVDVDVPYTGFYTLWFTGGVSNAAADHSSIYVDGVYAGEYEFCQSTVTHAGAQQLRLVYLEEGVHQITFRPDRTNTVATNYAQILKLIRFAAVKELAEVSELECISDDIIIKLGSTKALDAKVIMSDGFVFEGQKMSSGAVDPYISVRYESSDSNIASVSADGIVTAKTIGETTVKIIASTNSGSVEKNVTVTVNETGSAGDSGKISAVEIRSKSFVMSLDSAGIVLTAYGKAANENSIALTNNEILWRSSDETVARVDENGKVTPVSEGTAEISATITMDGAEITGTAVVSVRTGKTTRTYYNEDVVSAARENIKKYSWAKAIRDEAVEKADEYLRYADELWSMIPGEGLPRGQQATLRDDVQKWTCHYCGVNLYTDYGSYPWVVTPLKDRWKIQCPHCKRRFPSNDFEKLYELGLNDKGIYDQKLAVERNAELVEMTEGKVDYMRNDLYPEIGSENHPSTVKLSSGEDPKRWGVDSGFGYDTGRVWPNGVHEVHTYIAYYIYFGLWFERGTNNPGVIQSGLNALADAYIYTGDEKYGRAGAIMLDRVADVYPDMVVDGYANDFAITDGGSKVGVIIGRTWDAELATDFARAYDAFFPMYDDPQVISYLSKKAEQFDIGDKSNPEAFRSNIENGILRTIYDRVQTSHIHGNFGMSQSACGMAAVVLDTYPETDEMLDWVFRYGEGDSRSYNRGGDINHTLLGLVSRDGQGDESAPGYNRIWINELESLATTLARYTNESDVSIYQNPKYLTMIKSYAPLTLVRRGLPGIGDSGQTATYSLLPDNTNVMIEAFKYSGDFEIAQHLYFIKGGNINDMHYDIFTKNPENLSRDIREIIDTYGEYDYDKSSLLSGYGLGVLRAGTLHKSTASNVMRDTQRDFWIYFGGSVSHSHEDMLNLGIESYGIGMSTDLGYPEATGSDPNRIQWQNATISHNTVVVNEKSQLKSKYSYMPYHFEGRNSRVKVMDIDASGAYTETDEYRRTVVMVDYDSEVSYGIDFFKVRGGNDHLYSFHANSSINPDTSDNLNFEVQTGGSYAGADVPFGEDPNTVVNNAYAILKYPLGYTWLGNVRRADNPGVSSFYVDFEIEDFRKQSRNSKMDTRLRMTMVNDFDADEVTLATGLPPRKPENLNYIDQLQYMLVRRKGRDLNTLFTTVVEPYNGERYIKSIEEVSVEVIEGETGKFDNVKAIRVELVDGRVDYIVYSQNNSVTYRVADLFDFRGFVGVWTVNADGENIYSYISDGEKIGDDVSGEDDLDARIGGKIINFRKEHSSDNWLEVELDAEVKAEDLKDRMISVERKDKGNSVYMIKGAEMLDATRAKLDLGDITLINGFKDVNDEALGYTYDVAEGQSFVIPMSYEFNPSPIFDEVSDGLSTKVDSSISVSVNAESQDGSEITYSERTLPRGASFDAETGTVTWKPTSSQTGESLFAIDATDESGRTSTIYFTVTVYGATSGTGSSAGGAGGGAAPAPSKPVEDDKKDEDKKEETPTTPIAPSEPTTEENVRFVDLGSHAWAEDAINALAEEGIIKGTSEKTFSPAANITRADFTILLVRAFKLESDNTENFADVADSDYFAKELAIARNTGIVNGIGDNKYAPRNTITRQDMMTIVYRALGDKIESEMRNDTQVVPYEDFENVADYARDAVSALIGAGLVNGKSGKIAPTDYTTRAEVAVLIKRILDYTQK